MSQKESKKITPDKDRNKIGFLQKITRTLVKKINSARKPINDQRNHRNKDAEKKSEIKNQNNELTTEIVLVEQDAESAPIEILKIPTLTQNLVKSPIDEQTPKISNQNPAFEPFETLTSTPYNLKKSISLSQSTISSFEEKSPKINKSQSNLLLKKSRGKNYEASDEDIYMESFPTNTHTEEEILFRPLFKYLGVFVTNPDDYTRNYESEQTDFSELPEFFQAIQPPPGYFDVSISETNNLNIT